MDSSLQGWGNIWIQTKYNLTLFYTLDKQVRVLLEAFVTATSLDIFQSCRNKENKLCIMILMRRIWYEYGWKFFLKEGKWFDIILMLNSCQKIHPDILKCFHYAIGVCCMVVGQRLAALERRRLLIWIVFRTRNKMHYETNLIWSNFGIYQ